MDTGEQLRLMRESAAMSLRRMASRTHFTPGYLSRVETGDKPATEAVIAAYEQVLGIGLDTGHVNRREFLAVAATAAANAELVRELAASIAGGDATTLTVVQTSYGVDRAVAAVADRASLVRLRRWAVDEDNPVCRVNAAGILAKVPGQNDAGLAVDTLRRDGDVADRDRWNVSPTGRSSPCSACNAPHSTRSSKTSNATDSSPSATPPSTSSTPPDSPAWPPDDATIRWLCSVGSWVSPRV